MDVPQRSGISSVLTFRSCDSLSTFKKHACSTTIGAGLLPFWRTLALVESRRRHYFRDGKDKGKGFPYSTPSVGPGADPGVQAVSLQVTVSHPPGGKLPLLSARPAVTSPAAEHHRPLAGTKLYCLLGDRGT